MASHGRWENTSVPINIDFGYARKGKQYLPGMTKELFTALLFLHFERKKRGISQFQNASYPNLLF